MAKRMLLLLLFVVGTILLGYGFATAQDVNYNYDQTTDFSKFKTYKWAPVKGAKELDSLTDKNIIAAVDATLATKGLTKTDAEQADLLVGYEVALDQEKQIDAWGGGVGWRFGGGMASATTSTINVGTLVLDMYDPATKQIVWRGTATKTLDPKKDPEKRQEALQKAMTKLLKNYPPAKKS